eukprot:11959815-Ditylum_brightwellii.AAC.1
MALTMYRNMNNPYQSQWSSILTEHVHETDDIEEGNINTNLMMQHEQQEMPKSTPTTHHTNENTTNIS